MLSSTWKVIKTDNYARETVAERLVAETSCEASAKRLCEFLRNSPERDDTAWYIVKPGDYVLWRGMEEFV